MDKVNEGADVAEKGADAAIQTALEGLFKWYIARPENARLGTIYNDSELAIVENKATFLAALRSSGHFSSSFVDRLQKEYDDCETQYGAEDLDDHLPCLDVDPVTVKAGFDQFSSVNILSLTENGDQATATVKLSGKKELSAGATQDRTSVLKVKLVQAKGKWVADSIGENEE